LKIGAKYNTQAAFDFENISKLEHTGDEDQIIQKVALGMVTALKRPANLALLARRLSRQPGQRSDSGRPLALLAMTTKGKSIDDCLAHGLGSLHKGRYSNKAIPAFTVILSAQSHHRCQFHRA
ncbi:MAG: hypothetical protein EBW14_14335, partial [Oxalobacteraceae bacterium]|nr:hypothetical protein [Oxalobacteraceae bacterium]